MGNALLVDCYWVDMLVTLVPLLHIEPLLPCTRNVVVGVRSDSEAGETRTTEREFSLGG